VRSRGEHNESQANNLLHNIETLRQKPSQSRDKDRLTLQTHLPLVLQSVKEGYTQTRIAEHVGVSKQAVSKLMKRLVEHEYIRLVERSGCNIYEVLPRGQLVLSGGRNLFKSGIGRLHNLRFKYPIMSGEVPRDQWSRVEMVNWDKQVEDVFGVKVEVSERSVVISPGIFFGYQMADLLLKASEVADSVARWLTHWFKLELGAPRSAGKPEWAVVTPLPALALSNMNLRTLDSWLDASMGMAEVEFTDMDRAQKFTDMPQMLDRIMGSLKEHRSLTEVKNQSTMSQQDDNQESTASPSDMLCLEHEATRLYRLKKIKVTAEDEHTLRADTIAPHPDRNETNL